MNDEVLNLAAEPTLDEAIGYIKDLILRKEGVAFDFFYAEASIHRIIVAARSLFSAGELRLLMHKTEAKAQKMKLPKDKKTLVAQLDLLHTALRAGKAGGFKALRASGIKDTLLPGLLDLLRKWLLEFFLT